MILAFMLALLPSPEKVVYAAGYIPNIQFAPFYLAEAKGYYREEGIALEMDYTIGPDVFKLVALNKAQIGSADPDAFLHAVARGLPLLHVATLYQRYPIALIAREPIAEAKQIRGKKVGISGTFGSSYLGLKAILSERNLALGDIQLKTIGFNQVTALGRGQVDAVVGYVNHEPLILKQQGIQTYHTMLREKNALPGVGLMTNRDFQKEKPALLQGFLRATFRGLSEIQADPKAAFELVVDKFLPQLKGSDRIETEYAVLLATLPFWQTAFTQQMGLGQCEKESWNNLKKLLDTEKGLPKDFVWTEWVDFSFRYKVE